MPRSLVSSFLWLVLGCAFGVLQLQADEPLSLKLERVENMENAPYSFKLTIVNVSKEEVRIDSEWLNLSVMIDLQNEEKKRMPTVIPSIPRPFNLREIRTLKPSETIVLEFNLKRSVKAPFDKFPYTLKLCYSTMGEKYPGGYDVWQGKVCSNSVVIEK